MSDSKVELSGPDFVQGVALSTVADGTMQLGQVHGEAPLFARRGGECFAIGNVCTHYGAPRAPALGTEQYDFSLAYIGYAERWDHAEIDGKLAARNCTITYRDGGRKPAVAVIHRDLEGLRAEPQFERMIAGGASP